MVKPYMFKFVLLVILVIIGIYFLGIVALLLSVKIVA